MIRTGTKVQWKWGNGTAAGTVEETFTKTTERSIDGTTVVRHGKVGDKALLIVQEDGQEVLKLESEVVRKE